MAFLNDLWNGIKTVGRGILEITGTLIETLVEGFFWLVDKVFDAVEAVLDLFDWLFETIGEIFSPNEKEKKLIILPTTQPLIDVVNTNLENGNYVTAPEKVKLRRKLETGEAKVSVVMADGKIKSTVITGSDKGFSADIKSATNSGMSYHIPIE